MGHVHVTSQNSFVHQHNIHRNEGITYLLNSTTDSFLYNFKNYYDFMYIE